MISIKYGCTRMVFLFGDYAIKIPIVRSTWEMFLLGLLGNMQEKLFSEIYNDAVSPVIFSIPGGWLNIMKRVRTLSSDDFLCFDYHYWCNYKFPYKIVIVENKQDSFGWLNGEIVACDYGN